MVSPAVLALTFLAPVRLGVAEVLTKGDFEGKVFGSGKQAFVKFLAPW